MSTVDNTLQGEASIARCRVVLSVAALAAVFVDPTEPILAQSLPLSSGRFTIDPWVLAVMSTHLVFSLGLLANCRRSWIAPERLAPMTIWADVTFGAVIGSLTEGATSPFHPFFSFAVMVAGFRAGLRQAMWVTGLSVAVYLGLILVSGPGNANVYIMRPVYLAIAGYLVGYLGQQCIELQQDLRRLEAAEQRHRIARDLHDGFVQALAGINLRIEGCRRTLQRGDAEGALAELADLRGSVTREYDELRRYMRDLAGVSATPPPQPSTVATRLAFDAQVSGSLELLDQILLIVREGLSNIRKHAAARTAQISVRAVDTNVQIRIRDDGVGMAPEVAPWSIVSRVAELGGRIEMPAAARSGAELCIVLPG